MIKFGEYLQESNLKTVLNKLKDLLTNNKKAEKDQRVRDLYNMLANIKAVVPAEEISKALDIIKKYEKE